MEEENEKKEKPKREKNLFFLPFIALNLQIILKKKHEEEQNSKS